MLKLIESATEKCYACLYEEQNNKLVLFHRIILEENAVFAEFKGALTEQFVARELASSGIELYYYSAENSSGEVDFIVQRRNKVIPVEVKAEENLQQ